jgi:Fe2+ or Zn2+ uptake regulation protein
MALQIMPHIRALSCDECGEVIEVPQRLWRLTDDLLVFREQAEEKHQHLRIKGKKSL